MKWSEEGWWGARDIPKNIIIKFLAYSNIVLANESGCACLNPHESFEIRSVIFFLMEHYDIYLSGDKSLKSLHRLIHLLLCRTNY